MSDAPVSFEEAAAKKVAAEHRQHDRSTIEFPYMDLDTAVEAARAVYSRAGLGSCELDELAAEMGQTMSGAFRMKTSTARLFGFLEKEGRGTLRLTELGRKLANSETEAEARAMAFVNIPLYRAIYEKYRGHLLPPTKALEREMAALGVAPKQTDKARQAFERSAKQAGFFAQSEDRLVQPRFDRDPQTHPIVPETPEGDPAPKRGGGGGGSGPIATQQKAVSEVLLAAFDPKDMDDTQQEAVWTLLKYFKSKGL
jgi:hypothetical protein